MMKIKTFELSVKSHPYIPVSTTRILSDYARDPPPDIPDAQLQEQRERLKEHEEMVNQLRQWVKYRGSSKVGRILRRVFLRRTGVGMPPEHQIYRSISHFFPPRAELRVIVCDFGDGRAERRENFGLNHHGAKFDGCVGLLHSSVEALFFHPGSKVMGKPFTCAGRAWWPYLEIETFDLRNAKSLQCLRDLLRMLQDEKSITDTLERNIFARDNNENLKKDLVWRA
ncbi:hypothetical protein MFIFM68171_03682 [Madurella fahalii]|uniref:Uncharacterized protein n=1 Tax=Madurella fahalii TaxID=1157608 RepID=A0ABQ0G6V8_9PEZI